MVLSLLRQLLPALHRGVVHLLGGELEALAQHDGIQAEIPGRQDRPQVAARQGVEGSPDIGLGGIADGENPGELSVDGGEDRVFHMEPLGQRNAHPVHEGGAAHQDPFSPDLGLHPPVIAVGDAVHPAVDRPLAAEQVVEDFIEPAAGGTDQARRTGHDLIHGKIPEDLDAVEGRTARREKVVVSEDNAVDPPVAAMPGQPQSADPAWNSRFVRTRKGWEKH